MIIPHTRPAFWPALREGRFARSIRYDNPEGCGLALLGLPDDTGVRLNGGRPGAALGPNAFRVALAGFGTPWDGATKQVIDARIFDAGDIEPVAGDDERALLATHARVTEAVLRIHELGLVPICIGGGHDLSLPSISALSKHSGHALGGINVDAHLDVRERVGSGMAFRRLIEGGSVDPTRFVEFGLGRFVNDAKDFQWAEDQGAKLVMSDQRSQAEHSVKALLERVFSRGNTGFLSIDLDGLDSAAVPGVSALNPAGLSVEHVGELAEAAGSEPRIRHFDIMELCPAEDGAGRSARVAAYLCLCFVSGFSRRRA